MVSADNLNFDVLGWIFSYLYEHDLVSISLVSHSFYDAAIPKLYKTLVFRNVHVKRYMQMKTSFSVVHARPSFAPYVQSFEILALPLYRGRPHLEFLEDCLKCLKLCSNLSSFHCPVNVLPVFLNDLTSKNHLQDIRVNAALTTEQSGMLANQKGLRKITLEHASWCVMNLFPGWMTSLSPTLTSLTINMSNDLNEVVLEQALAQLPNLLGLHVQSCMKIEHGAVLRLISYIPLLEDLSLTIWEAPQTPPTNYASLNNLRSLNLDTRNTTDISSTKTAWNHIFSKMKASRSPLRTLTLKTADLFIVTDDIINDIVVSHSSTISNLRFYSSNTSLAALENLAKSCKSLQKLTIIIPNRDLNRFSSSLGNSQSLHTLIDASEHHVLHIFRPALNSDNARQLMERISSLKKVISGNRCWKGLKSDNGALRVTLDRIRQGQYN